MKEILLIASQEEIVIPFTRKLSAKYTVQHVCSESEGKTILEHDYEKIAAVLMDIGLAREGRYALADWMMADYHFSLIPMIAVSAEMPVESESAECLEHGFFDIIHADAPQKLIHMRIDNAIHGKDSLSTAELERVLKALPVCIFLKDAEGRYVFSTKYWRHIAKGDDPNWTIRGKTDLDIRFDKENAQKAMEADRKIIETGKGTDYIIEENEDGVQEFLHLIKCPVFEDDGSVSGIIALISNVTEFQQLKMELEKRAKTDALTGLLNKKAEEELVRMLLPNYKKEGGRSAMLMIDLDKFKAINDTFGHAEGDRVLATVGGIIRTTCRAQDVAGRIGGDEFLIYMRSIKAPENACSLAERLIEKVKETFENDPLNGYVSLSIGIALCPEHAAQYDSLFAAADSALYYVKKHGRASYRFYDNTTSEAQHAKEDDKK